MSNVNFAHAHDHAVVNLNGHLDWDAAFAVVDTIDTMVETYFYTAIELVVSSPGGNTQALHYCLARLDQLANDQVRLRTRVLSFAGSAAAVLVSAGDERIVETGAMLAWHGAQIRSEHEADARATAALASALSAADDRLIDRLVSRALATSGTERPAHRPEPADRRVLELLAEALRSKDETKVPRKFARLARAVGAVVDRAVRDADRKALSNVYRRLFELDATVSGCLAVTLRLVDRVGAAPADETVGPGVDGLTVPEWRVLYPPHGAVPRDVLTRHALVLGETGSGKTASCILPVVAAMAAAPRERLGGALVIDPKRELAQALHRIAPERLHHVRADATVLNVMAGPRWSLDDDVREKRWLSAARRILCRVASFCPSTPARVLMDHEISYGNAEFFNREGTALAMSLLAFLLLLLDERTPSPATWLEADVAALTWADALLERARGPEGPNALALLAWVLDGPLMSSRSSRRGVLFSVEAGEAAPVPRSEWLFARLARAALKHVCTESGEGRDLCGRIVDYWTPMVEVQEQYAGVRATAASVCADFAAAAVARTVYFGCEPGYHAREGGNGLDFARLVAPHGPGTLVLVQPARDGQDTLVAIALKATFFEAVLDDPARSRGGRRPAARRLRRGRVPPIRHIGPAPRRAVVPRHVPVVRRGVCARVPVGREHPPRACARRRELRPEPRRGRDPVEQHRVEARVPLDRSGGRGAGVGAEPAPSGASRGGAGASGLDPRPGRVLRLARGRAVRAPPARALPRRGPGRGPRASGRGPRAPGCGPR